MSELSYEDRKQLAVDIVQENLPLFNKIHQYCVDAQDEFLRTHKFTNPYAYEADDTFGDVLMSIIDDRKAFKRELDVIDYKYVLPNVQTDDDYESVWNNIYTEILIEF